nr:hypothetical protein [Actinomadura madurae]
MVADERDAAADVDDRAATAVGDERAAVLQAEEHPVKVDPHDVAPRLVGGSGHRAGGGHPGVVDQAVQPSEPGLDLPGGLPPGVLGGDVERDRDGRAGPRDRTGQRGGLLGAQVADDRVGAAGGEPPDLLRALAARPAGDQHHLACDVRHLATPLLIPIIGA